MTNIFVGNLSFRTTEQDIRNAFLQFGQVAAVNIVMDQDTGRSRGFAFVEMSDSNEASAAIEGLHERELVGRRVVVNEARPRVERPKDGGRYGSGRGGSRPSGTGNDRARDGGGGARRGNYSRDDR